MERLGHQFLARSSCSRHQHGSEMGSDSSYFGVDLQHEGAASDDALELIRIDEFLIKTQSLLPGFSLRQEGVNPGAEFVNFNRLRQVIRSTLLNSLHG